MFKLKQMFSSDTRSDGTRQITFKTLVNSVAAIVS